MGKVKKALERKKIAKGSCATANERCSGRIEAHHNSYLVGDELKVTWFCKRHHAAWHRVFIPDREEDRGGA